LIENGSEDKKLIMNLSQGLAKAVSSSMELEAKLKQANLELEGFRSNGSATKKRKLDSERPESGK
jgi:hypothetical protein